jgi:2'-5' RNA ligase
MSAKYSIWLETEEENASVFRKLIGDFATSARTSFFDPHITLIGSLTEDPQILFKKMAELCLNVKPFEIKFDALEINPLFFQAITLLATPTSPLTDLNKHAQELFSKSYTYKPHLSLLYGDLEKTKKEDLAKKILKTPLEDFTFPVAHISLWEAQGPVENWKRLDQVSL